MATREDPYITLEEGEDVAQADCNCSLVRNNDGSVDLFLCALHLEAIE